MKVKKLSIIIPSYNEEDTILKVIKKVKSVTLSKIKKEIIVVDDGSTDTTSLKLRGASKTSDGKLIILKHKMNRGKGAAIRSALKKVTGDVVLLTYTIPMLPGGIAEEKLPVLSIVHHGGPWWARTTGALLGGHASAGSRAATVGGHRHCSSYGGNQGFPSLHRSAGIPVSGRLHLPHLAHHRHARHQLHLRPAVSVEHGGLLNR